jgi:hypothetical protein
VQVSRLYGVSTSCWFPDWSLDSSRIRHLLNNVRTPLLIVTQVTEANREELKRLKAQRREEYLQRIPVEGKFGQGKNGYNLNYIRAKRADTSFAWINSIFLVMNLLILIRIFFVLCKRGVAVARMPLLQVVERLARYQLAHDTRRRESIYQMATS